MLAVLGTRKRNDVGLNAERFMLSACDRFHSACSEERATLESDPSAEAGEYTDGQG
jgi:hypothetical protein